MSLSSVSCERKIDMITMRINGCTLEEIGRKYDISKQRVQQIIGNLQGYRSTVDRVVYPNIRKWMLINGTSIAALARYIPNIKYDAIYRALIGETDPSFEMVSEILNLTGMTFEDAFRK